MIKNEHSLAKVIRLTRNRENARDNASEEFSNHERERERERGESRLQGSFKFAVVHSSVNSAQRSRVSPTDR